VNSEKSDKFETINFFGLYTWLALVTGCLSLYFFRPEYFDPLYIRNFFSQNLIPGLSLYFIIATVRGITLIPLTPILLAGILIFPPVPFFLINFLAVISSSAVVYYMTHYFKFDRFFHQHYEKQIQKLTALLHQRELPVIAAWGFTPFVPSDLIVYVCSVLRISLFKTLLGISLGEGIICAIYIFGGAFSLNALLGSPA
jgi:uncharacterized membrane protein YdjX (TVP38/TMEM64 family)